jgi:hypothetical protein
MISLFYLAINNWDLIRKKISINFDWTIKKNLVKFYQILFVFFGVSFILLENILNILSDPLAAGDSLAYWFRKAKFFIYSPGIENFPAKNYPNFISSLWSISLYINYENFNFSRIILPFILFINVALVYYKFVINYKNFFLNTLLFFFVLTFYSTTTFAGHFRYSNGGYVDFALAVFLMSGFIYIILSFIDNIFYKKDYFFGCLCLGILSSIKNEGLVLSICLIFILNFLFLINYYQIYKKNFLAIMFSNICFITMATLPLILLEYLESVLKITITYDIFSAMNLTSLELLKARFPVISKYFFLALIENRVIFLAILFIFFVNIFFLIKLNFFLQLLILIILFCLFYIYGIYFTTNYPLEWHLITSINRIFFPFTGIICGLCFLFCNHQSKRVL